MDVNLQRFIDSCEQKLKEVTSDLKIIKGNIEEYIEEKIIPLLHLENKPHLQSRVKGTTSLREKIIRKRYHEKFSDANEFIQKLPDIIGVRLFCLLNTDERKLYEELRSKFTHQLMDGYSCLPGAIESNEPYLAMKLIGQPETQKNGEEIFRIPGVWVNPETGENTNVEVQIKSLVHMFWGEMEHMLFYKNYQYLVDAEFYSGMMHTIYSLLKNIDNQLEQMQKHLKAKDVSTHLDGFKQMIAKFMHDTYQPKINNLLACKIDCREVYEALVLAEWKNITTENALQTASQMILSISNKDLTETQFDFSRERIRFAFSNSPEDQLAESFIDLARSQDVYWRILFGLYKLHKPNNSITDSAKQLAESYLNGYLGFCDNLDEGNIGHKILTYGVKEGCVSAFKEYKKLDFFLPKRVHEGLKEIINEFVMQYQDQLEDIQGTSNDKIQEIIKLVISMQLKAYLSLEVKIEELRRLQQLIQEKDIEWVPEYLDRTQLDNYVKADKSIYGYQEIKSLLSSTGEVA